MQSLIEINTQRFGIGNLRGRVQNARNRAGRGRGGGWGVGGGERGERAVELLTPSP